MALKASHSNKKTHSKVIQNNKKNIMKPTLILACLLLIALASFAVAKTVVMGGKSQETDPQKIRELTAFLEGNIRAAAPNARIVKIVKVERQVVAGMNYFITVSVKHGENERQVVAKIFEPLSRTLGVPKPLKLVSVRVQ